MEKMLHVFQPRSGAAPRLLRIATSDGFQNMFHPTAVDHA